MTGPAKSAPPAKAGAAPRLRWYVARTHPHQEKLALQALEQRGFNGKPDGIGEVYLPLYAKRDPRRKDAVIAAPVFPTYLFVRFVHADQTGWTRVFSTRGVRQLICAGGNGPPLPVPDLVVNYCRSQEENRLMRLGFGDPDAPPAREFKRGDLVTIPKGPYAQLQGIFLQRIDGKRGEALIQLLGDSEWIATCALAHLE